jgi:c-di-GMP-binding flagellar brake protein YcgR
MAASQKVDMRSGAELNMSPGTRMVVEPVGLGKRFSTEFVGMERDAYLIVRVPRIAGVTEHLQKDKKVRVRTIEHGQVYGFEAEVAWIMSTPFRLLFLRYPMFVEVLNLRGSQRVECFLPAEFKTVDSSSWTRGLVLNISRGGCQVVLDPVEGGQPDIDVGAGVMLELRLPGSERVLIVGGQARNVRKMETRAQVGVQFDPETPPGTIGAVKEYVQNLTDYLRD